MSWVALLLIGIAVTDLVHSIRREPILPECVGAATVIVTGVLVDLHAAADIAALLVIAGVVIAWGQLVTWAFGRHGRGRPWVPLAVLAIAFVLALGLGPAASESSGLLGYWRLHLDAPGLLRLTPDQMLLVTGAFLVQLSTGNVVVRLVLAATDTLNPMRHGTAQDPEMQLKGGRLLGPLERVLILGLGMAGEVTAASIVVAAKGLLRFPELQSRREQERIHQLTEYFLLGSFLSWLIALGTLAAVYLGLKA